MNFRAWIAVLGLGAYAIAWANEPTWEDLLGRSRAELREAQRVLMEEHKAVSFERYDVDLERGEIALSSEGVPGLVGSVVYVGLYSQSTRRWLWGWADGNVPSHLSQRLEAVRDFGTTRGFKSLSRKSWRGNTTDAQDMTAIALLLLKGKAMYRQPSMDGQHYRYWVFTDLRPAK